VQLPARRAGCRPAPRPFGEPVRMYVAGREPDGTVVVDVVDGDGILREQWHHRSGEDVAIAVLGDATGHPPRPATASAFADALSDDGFAISSAEVCAWLLVRAIDRAENA
jgi:hypothetical protein